MIAASVLPDQVGRPVYSESQDLRQRVPEVRRQGLLAADLRVIATTLVTKPENKIDEYSGLQKCCCTRYLPFLEYLALKRCRMTSLLELQEVDKLDTLGSIFVPCPPIPHPLITWMTDGERKFLFFCTKPTVS